MGPRQVWLGGEERNQRLEVDKHKCSWQRKKPTWPLCETLFSYEIRRLLHTLVVGNKVIIQHIPSQWYPRLSCLFLPTLLVSHVRRNRNKFVTTAPQSEEIKRKAIDSSPISCLTAGKQPARLFITIMWTRKKVRSLSYPQLLDVKKVIKGKHPSSPHPQGFNLVRSTSKL